MAITIYELKPRFQALLRPLVGRLAAAGIRANQLTVAAALGSVALGICLWIGASNRQLFLFLPLWLFVRMALNAADGMLAREFGQRSALGAYLNELGDAIADAALYLPFALIPPFGLPSVGLVVLLAIVSEFAGALATMVSAPRRYDGPMGKSDRAFIFGALGLYIGLNGPLPETAFWLMPAIAALIAWNIVNRVRRGVAAAG